MCLLSKMKKFHRQPIHQVRILCKITLSLNIEISMYVTVKNNNNYILQVIHIAATNPSSTSGWKSTNCVKETNDALLDCMEANAYFVRDILISKENHKFQPVYKKDKIVGLFTAATNQSINIKTYYVANSNGLVHIFKADAGVITKNLSSTLNIHLNKNMSYFLLINDPKVSIPTAMSDTVSRLLETIEEGPGIITLNLKVKGN